MKKLLCTICLLLTFVLGWTKQKTEVWHNPMTSSAKTYGDGFFRIAIDVTMVELKADETVVHLHVSQRSDYPNSVFQYQQSTHLRADSVDYPILRAEGMPLGQWIQTDKNGQKDVVFHFAPLPRGTRQFDLIEGPGERDFNIYGISPVEAHWPKLFPSYWRNEQTGAWDIAILESCVVYKSRFWEYKEQHFEGEGDEMSLEKASMVRLTLADGDDEVTMILSPCKKGRRTITIDEVMQEGNATITRRGMKQTYSMITGRFLPDYPVKDNRTDFVDTGYQPDTVTVNGWIRNLPENERLPRFYEFCTNDFFSGEQQTFTAMLDEEGRFTLRFPLLNTSEFFCDWGRTALRTMLEPGRTYFLLYDWAGGKRLWMGDDARVQNELMRFPLEWGSIRMEQGQDFDAYLASADSLIRAQHIAIDAFLAAHPMLSERFVRYRKGNSLWQQAREIGQARFCTPDFQLPANACQYAYDHFWKQLEQPYTLHRELLGFLRYYIGDADRRHGGKMSISFDLKEHCLELAQNDEERELFTRWKSCIAEAQQTLEALATLEEQQQYAERINAENAELIKSFEQTINDGRLTRYFSKEMIFKQCRSIVATLDSLGADDHLRQQQLASLALQQIDRDRASLAPEVMDSLRQWITIPIAFAQIESANATYLALENQELKAEVHNSPEALQGLTEGEELLRKILEPYRGKLVLIDLWGTWCGPCKDALRHSQEEYKRLEPYDVVFLYLANNSPQQSWENVIKAYEVTGPNVVHYNLPADQQSAIEQYLDVHAFPTFKLVNREGQILDVNADPRNLDALERVVKQL